MMVSRREGFTTESSSSIPRAQLCREKRMRSIRRRQDWESSAGCCALYAPTAATSAEERERAGTATPCFFFLSLSLIPSLLFFHQSVPVELLKSPCFCSNGEVMISAWCFVICPSMSRKKSWAVCLFPFSRWETVWAPVVPSFAKPTDMKIHLGRIHANGTDTCSGKLYQ